MRYTHPVLRVRALKKEYRCGIPAQSSTHAVFDGLDFDLYGGQVVTVVARQGWGKTTLLLCLSGIMRPTSGKVQWAFPHGALGRTANSAHPGIMYLPQRPSYYNFLSVRETLDYYAFANGIGGNDGSHNTDQVVDEALGRVGLASVQHLPLKKLPAPEIRRLQMAEALIRPPNALLLDETLTDVDSLTFGTLRDIILDLAAAGTVIVIATRELSLARRLGARPRLLAKGGGGYAEGLPITLVSLSS